MLERLTEDIDGYLASFAALRRRRNEVEDGWRRGWRRGWRGGRIGRRFRLVHGQVDHLLDGVRLLGPVDHVAVDERPTVVVQAGLVRMSA